MFFKHIPMSFCRNLFSSCEGQSAGVKLLACEPQKCLPKRFRAPHGVLVLQLLRWDVACWRAKMLWLLVFYILLVLPPDFRCMVHR